MAEQGDSAVVGARMLQVRRSAGVRPEAYVLCDREGRRVGGVSAVEIPRKRRALRMVTNFLDWTDARPGVRLEVTDLGNAPLFSVVFAPEDERERAVVRSRDGEVLGEIAKAKGVRKIHFDLRAGGVTLGTVEAEGWSGWEYRILQAGAPVGRIAMLKGDKVLGIVQTTDDFVLELDFDLADPFRTLVVACAVGIDSSVSQDD